MFCVCEGSEEAGKYPGKTASAGPRHLKPKNPYGNLKIFSPAPEGQHRLHVPLSFVAQWNDVGA